MNSRKAARKQARLVKCQRKAQNYMHIKREKKLSKKAAWINKVGKVSENAQRNMTNPLTRRSSVAPTNQSNKAVYDTSSEIDPILAFVERSIEAGILGSNSDFDEDDMERLLREGSSDEDDINPPKIINQQQDLGNCIPEPSSKDQNTPSNFQKYSFTLTNGGDSSLRKRINGQINRLTCSNFESVAKYLSGLFDTYPRHEVKEGIIESVLLSITKQANLLDAYILNFSALLTTFTHLVGIDFIGTVLEKVVGCIDENRLEIQKGYNCNDASPEREIMHCIILLSFLYNLQMISHQIILDIIDEATCSFSELDVEILVKLIRNCGAQLKRDESNALRDLIKKIFAEADRIPDAHRTSRFKFMLETIQDLRNNRQLLVAVQHGELEVVKKTIRNYIQQNNQAKAEPVALSLKDLREAKVKGKWWKVGAAWNPDCSEIPKTKQQNESSLVDIYARQQKMNTDVRKLIFAAIMSSEDYLDAYQKILALKLTSRQEREVAYILLHCCANEKVFNPFYSLVACKFMETRHNFIITFKYALWDKLERIDADGVPLKELLHLAKFYGISIARGIFPLVSLKRVSFAQLSPTCSIFFQTLFTTIFERQKDDSKISLIFCKLSDFKDQSERLPSAEDIFEGPSDQDVSIDEDNIRVMKVKEINTLRAELSIFFSQLLMPHIRGLQSSSSGLLERRLDLAIKCLKCC